MHAISHSSDRISEVTGLPLTIPGELWAALSPDQKDIYRRAQNILTELEAEHQLSLTDILVRVQAPLPEVLPALQVLDTMSLVDAEATGTGPVFTLRAIPDEHVRIVGPTGQVQWLFVARPIEPPEIPEALLN
jgi:hypothetical protein